jgi:hypothetical protein
MKKRIPTLLLIAIFSLFLLSGCINLVQEMTVREDGSGSLRFALGVETGVYQQVMEQIPESFLLQNLLSNLIQDENVVDVVQDHYEADGRTWDTIELEVMDFAALFAEDRRIGPLMVTLDEDNGVYSYEEVIDLVNSNLVIPGINLLDLTGAGYTVRLITPQIMDTNGLQEAAGVSVWEVPLSELLRGGETVTLRADYVLAPYEGVFIPWETFFPYVVMGFLALGGIAVLVVVIVNTTKRRKKKRKYRF